MSQIIRFLGSLFFLSLCISSCGYRWTPEDPILQGRKTVSVPYIEGDCSGALTGEVVRALAASGAAMLKQSGAEYELRICILQSENKTIGYRRDRQEISGELKKNLVASEARKTVAVEVSLYRNAGKELFRGPIRVEADVDYDYVDGDSIQDLEFLNPDGVPTVVLPFSLGQLESRDSAEEAASRPLHARLAKKILDLIFVAW